MKKEYTPEETALFKAERNKKRNEERHARKNPEVIWNSKDVKTGRGKTFIGSVRKDLIEVEVEVTETVEPIETAE